MDLLDKLTGKRILAGAHNDFAGISLVVLLPILPIKNLWNHMSAKSSKTFG